MAETTLLCKVLQSRRMDSNIKIEFEPVGEGNSDLTAHLVKKELNESLICRACLKDGNIPIFGSTNTDNILDMFKTIAGVDVKSDDTYPQFLCKSCNMHLQGAIIFRKTAQESDLFLKNPSRNGDNDVTADFFEEDNTFVKYKNVTIKKVKTENIAKLNNIKSEVIYCKQDRLPNSNKKIEKNMAVKLKDKINKNQLDKNSLKYETLSVTIINLTDSENDVAAITSTDSENNAATLNSPDSETKSGVNYKHFKHKHQRSNIGSWYCKTCDISFNSRDEYKKHRSSENHENIKRECPICHKTYGASYFRNHITIHNNDTPYMCDICGKQFQKRDTFLHHRQIHFFDLPFKCSVCPYKGRSREGLKIHMRSHTGERPYQCTQCPSRFIHKSNLNKHSLIHKKEQRFKCEPCNRGFYTKTDLDLHHKVVHIGVKDHICKTCGKAFGYKKVMRRHERQVHKREKLRSGRTPVYLKVEIMKQQGLDVPDSN